MFCKGQPCASTSSCPATMIEYDLPAPVSCLTTPSAFVGSTCSTSTTWDAINPDTVKENKSMVVQVFRYRVADAGANATPGDTDDRDAFVQGIYIP